jgi:hypothetical protein
VSADPSAPWPAIDVLRLPLVGRFLRWRHASAVMRLPVLVVAVAMIAHGLAGPRLAPKNLATVLTWLHFRGLLVLGLLLAGNWFCMACPFILVRDVARRFVRPTRLWPQRLSHKGPAILLFVLLLFAYERFDLWATPVWTAVLLLAYFGGALALGVLFRGAPFCRSVCPLGQFNLVSSLVSPLEVQVRDGHTCDACRTKDCIRGRGEIRGCELGLFQPLKVGNMNCHVRLDCVRACPYDNVGILPRVPGSELWVDPVRSGIGRLSQRPDLAALVVVYAFGALLNAFGMVSPVYTLEAWLADALHTQSETVVLGLIFLGGLVVVPGLLLGLAGWLTRQGTGSDEGVIVQVTRYAYALVPLGFGVWLAHFAFHFFTGALTIVPLLQSTLEDLGWPLLGAARWDLGPIVPAGWVFPVEVGFMGLGWFGSLLVAYRLAGEHEPDRSRQAFLPWAGLLLLLLLAGIWLMAQPMEMRATFLGG